MSTTGEQVDREMILRVLFEEMYSVPLAERQRRHWVMDGEMWQMLRDLFAPEVPPFALPTPRGDGLTLLGLSVELRAGAEGARLIQDGAAR